MDFIKIKEKYLFGTSVLKSATRLYREQIATSVNFKDMKS